MSLERGMDFTSGVVEKRLSTRASYAGHFVSIFAPLVEERAVDVMMFGPYMKGDKYLMGKLYDVDKRVSRTVDTCTVWGLSMAERVMC